ncbi:MAG: nitrile hydratase subunit beta [Candidatus Latescibacteria bacterium]|jgi:nitrile hydratase subunit beta|nr:nitrile hydratase subunit beta [Candidatus Latescibacterota bacterium]
MALIENTKFQIGDLVRVRVNHTSGHCRTPQFVQGKTGEVVAVFGQFPNPEQRAYGSNGLPHQILYQVCFDQTDLWVNYSGPEQDTLRIDLFEHWLESVSTKHEV